MQVESYAIKYVAEGNDHLINSTATVLVPILEEEFRKVVALFLRHVWIKNISSKTVAVVCVAMNP